MKEASALLMTQFGTLTCQTTHPLRRQRTSVGLSIEKPSGNRLIANEAFASANSQQIDKVIN